MAKSKSDNSKRGPKQPSPEFMDKLKSFVRTEGASYLEDPNITSVGIGYKQVAGERTDEVAIQFTVGTKLAPETLSAVATTAIPKSFVVEGIEVPTDVLERTYDLSFRVVQENTPTPRKTRVDPIAPGISIANRRVSAGTIGCIVYDQRTGAPYILSNWHVLQGSQGQIGDDVVQPGPHDDNRTDRNRLGRLVRSHLGAAGDCAVASIDERRFVPEVLDLGVRVEQIGEPELKDRVVKSGRTTGVTYGIVSRVHTIARLNYGGSTGLRDIGGFEIEPDPEQPAEAGEISMGGDSGSAWLFRDAKGRTTGVMAGLHFAGEAQGEPNEHALACYPRSVFEKLEVTLTLPAAVVTESGSVRVGYAPDFLGPVVDLPALTEAGRSDAYQRDGSEVIPYTHFSLAMSESRRFALWVAWNIDGSRLKKLSRKGIPFALDPDIPADVQVDDSLYAGNRLDRGHIARRADLCWGGATEAQQANRDSFFFTNITPQIDNFNQSSQSGIWGSLEDAVYAEVDVADLRVSVFGGPVFRSDDREYRGVKIPREFFKVIAYMEDGRLEARAFLLTQNIEQLEVLDLDEFRVYQVTLQEVEKRTQVRFPRALKAADSFTEPLRSGLESPQERAPLRSLADIRW
jgi:endonuclease G